VEEVLAVGDLAFQQKCLGKMEETASVGRTVLFVSHNTAAVRALCQRAYLLDAGRIVASGSAATIADEYVSAVQSRQAIPLHGRDDRGGDGTIRITSVEVADAAGGVITSSSRLRVTLTYESVADLQYPRFAVTIQDEGADWAFYRLDTDAEPGLPHVLPARGTIVCVTGAINLTAGECGLKVAAWRGGTLADHVERAGSFAIHADDFYPSGRVTGRDRTAGLIRHNWALAGSGDGAE
jgi:lipopolysaccharide transport system ATP-binding protein